MKVLEHYFPVDTLAPISIDYDYGFTCNFMFDGLQDWVFGKYRDVRLLEAKCVIFKVVRSV